MTAPRSMPERASALGLSCREYLDMARSDPRIVAYPAMETSGGIARLKRWIDAGRPSADARDARIESSDNRLRAAIIDTMAGLPAPVRWHACSFVTWFVVGPVALGWQGEAPDMPRPPDGDTHHVIMLSGHAPAEHWQHIIAHELAHSWQLHIRTIPLPMPHVTDPDERDRIIMQIVPADELARKRYRCEVLADAQAAAWGHATRMQSSDYTRARAIRAELEAIAGDRT